MLSCSLIEHFLGWIPRRALLHKALLPFFTLHGVQVVGGSNPLAPTRQNPLGIRPSGFFTFPAG